MEMKLVVIVVLMTLASGTAVGCINQTKKPPAATPDAAIQIAKDAAC